MPRVGAFAKPILPMIHDPLADGRKRIIARQRLQGSEIIIASSKDHVPVDIADLREPLSVTAV